MAVGKRAFHFPGNIKTIAICFITHKVIISFELPIIQSEKYFSKHIYTNSGVPHDTPELVFLYVFF